MLGLGRGLGQVSSPERARQRRVLRAESRDAAEVLLDVGPGAEEPLLLAAPEGDADGAAGLEAEGLEDADGLHHHGDAGRVVGGAGAAVPGVHVAAEHDELVLQVGAGDLGDGVVAIRSSSWNWAARSTATSSFSPWWIMRTSRL